MKEKELNKLKLAISRIKERLWYRGYVEFRLYSIQKSYEYNPYRDIVYENYRTAEPEGLFKELAKFRHKFREVNDFLNERLFKVILDNLPEDMKKIIEKAKKLNEEARKHNLRVEIDIDYPMFIKVPSKKIIEVIEELERELGLS